MAGRDTYYGEPGASASGRGARRRGGGASTPAGGSPEGERVPREAAAPVPTNVSTDNSAGGALRLDVRTEVGAVAAVEAAVGPAFAEFAEPSRGDAGAADELVLLALRSTGSQTGTEEPCSAAVAKRRPKWSRRSAGVEWTAGDLTAGWQRPATTSSRDQHQDRAWQERIETAKPGQASGKQAAFTTRRLGPTAPGPVFPCTPSGSMRSAVRNPTDAGWWLSSSGQRYTLRRTYFLTRPRTST